MFKWQNTFIKKGGKVKETKEYLLTKIDPEFWRRVKSVAASEGVTIRDLIIRLLEKEMEKYVEISIEPVSNKAMKKLKKNNKKRKGRK